MILNLKLIFLTLLFALPAFAAKNQMLECERALGVDTEAQQARHDREIAREQNKFIKAYSKAARELQRNPTLAELASILDMTPQDLESVLKGGTLFDGIKELKERAIEKNPKAFTYFTDLDVFTSERSQKLLDAIKSNKHLILTTAVAGAKVNTEFLSALQNYAKLNDAEIIVIPAYMVTTGLDPVLFNTPGVHVMINSIELSPWLNLNNVKILPKKVSPLQGLDVVGPRGQTQIVGSPKMHVKIVPTLDNQTNPHQLMTTGAITNPTYNENRYLPRTNETIAAADHVMGALVLERTNGGPNTMGIPTAGTYHARHIEYVSKKAGFTDLGKFYAKDSVKKISPKALVLGDIHVGETDQTLLDSVKKLISELKPEIVVLHDLLNGHSISHHERNKLISLAQKAKEGLLNLDKEIRDVVTFLNSLMAVDSGLQIVVVPSNHNFWLHRWLQEGEFMKDNQNRSKGLELAKAYADGEDPVEYALTNGGIEPAKKKRITFLPVGAHYKVGPEDNLVELAMHGDAGANGAKGTLRTLHRGTLRVVFGHSHTDQRMNGAVNVGTSTALILPYSKNGLSNWSQSLALVSENGEIQSLRLQDGEWYTDPDQQALTSDSFFMPEYPRLIEIPFGQ